MFIDQELLIILTLQLWIGLTNKPKSQLVSFHRSNNTGTIDVKMEGSVLR